MNYLEILSLKETNNLSIIEGHLKHVPALLFFDEPITTEIKNRVYEYFPFDVVRIGQSQGFADTLVFSNTPRGLSLNININYDNKLIKAYFSSFNEDFAECNHVIGEIDDNEDINQYSEMILDALDGVLKDIGQRTIDHESKKCSFV